MPNIMFKVGDTDYSAHVIDSTNGYKVQTDPIYTEWTDANGIDHRSVYRDRTTGTFTLFFRSIDEYQSFCTVMANSRQNDTSYRCTVFDNNSNTQVVSNFFITYTPVRHRTDDLLDDYVAAISVTIKER